MMYLDLEDLYETNKIESLSMDYLDMWFHLQMLQLYYGMSDEEISRYMYFYGDGYGY